MPLVESFGPNLSQIFAKDLTIHLKEYRLAMVLEKLEEIGKGQREDEPRLTDEEFNCLVDQADFNVE